MTKVATKIIMLSKLGILVVPKQNIESFDYYPRSSVFSDRSEAQATTTAYSVLGVEGITWNILEATQCENSKKLIDND